MSLPRIINWLRRQADREQPLALEGLAPVIIDVGSVTSVLKGRRLQKRRAAFRGFDSPPVRF
jgi:hypothetical protein